MSTWRKRFTWIGIIVVGLAVVGAYEDHAARSLRDDIRDELEQGCREVFFCRGRVDRVARREIEACASGFAEMFDLPDDTAQLERVRDRLVKANASCRNSCSLRCYDDAYFGADDGAFTN